MTPIEQQIVHQLECKERLDNEYEGGVDEPIAWLLQAVELLLRHQLELRKELNELMTKELCRQITKEVVEELRNNGILR